MILSINKQEGYSFLSNQNNSKSLFDNSNISSNALPVNQGLFSNTNASNNSSGGQFGNNNDGGLFKKTSGQTGANTGLNLFNNGNVSGGQFNNNTSLFQNNTQNNLFQNNSGGKKAKEPDSDRESENSEQSEKEPEKDKKEEVKTGGLFSNLVQPKTDFFGKTNEEKPSGGGLFSNLTDAQANQKTGLFGNMTASGGLFSGLIDSSKSNKTGTGTNIFSGNISSTFLKPQEQEENGDGEESEEENDQNEKEEVIDKNASTGNYQYDQKTDQLIIKEVTNFKVNDIPGYGKGHITLEKMKENGNVMIIFRNPAKLIKYQGIQVKELSNTDYMKSKDDAIFIISFTFDDKKSIVRNNTKMQFNNPEDAKEVIDLVKKQI